MVTVNSVRKPARPVGIRALGYYLPRRCLRNQDLIRLGCPVTEEWIVEKTGIRSRYVAEETEAMSDLAIHAAGRVLHTAGLSPHHLDGVLVAGDYHDSGGMQLTSALVAQGLGMSETACFDLRVGCPASVTALHQGAALVASDLVSRLLVTVAEINTRDVDYADRTAVWFGDGAGAAILEPCTDDTGILATFVAGTGANSGILTVPAGGSREPLTREALDAGRHRLYMDGRAVFPFAVARMVETVKMVTAFLGLEPGELDWIVPHQANLRIIQAAMEQLRLPMTRAYVNLDRVGNTAGPSVLLALAEAYTTGVIQPGDLVATVGFGGGLAWGAQVIRMNHASDFEPVATSNRLKSQSSEACI